MTDDTLAILEGAIAQTEADLRLLMRVRAAYLRGDVGGALDFMLSARVKS